MRGLTLQEEQHRPRPTSGCESSEALVRDAAVPDTTGHDQPQAARLLPSALALPTATPERRRLAPTEFTTPSPPGQQLAGGRGEVAADPVLARLVRGFGGVDKNVPKVFSSPRFVPPSVLCSSSVDNVGAAVSITGSLPSTADPATAVEPFSFCPRHGGQQGRSIIAAIAPGIGAEAAASGKADEDGGSAAAAAVIATVAYGTARMQDSVPAHASKTLVGDFDGHARKDGRCSGARGDRDNRIDDTKVRRIALSKNEGEEIIDVPDEEWRR